MKLIFLHGPPAVGKLTVARELARLTGIKLFHNHLTVDLVGSVFSFGSKPFVELREEIWLTIFGLAANYDISLIFTFAPEGTVRPKFIQDTINVIEAAGGEVIFVELTCDEDEIERRLNAPSRREFDKLQSIEQYRRLKKSGAFQFPRIASSLAVDTTKIDSKAAAQIIAAHLKA